MTAIRVAPVEHYRPVRGLRAWLADRSPAVPGEGTRRHAGVDLGAPRGTPVRAPENGRVTVVAQTSPGYDEVPPWTGYGPEVVVLHGAESGRYHLLSHVQRPTVTEGQWVRRGEPVAEVSRLAHVHWEVRVLERAPRGVEAVENVLDPLAWLEGHDRLPFPRRARRRPYREPRRSTLSRRRRQRRVAGEGAPVPRERWCLSWWLLQQQRGGDDARNQRA